MLRPTQTGTAAVDPVVLDSRGGGRRNRVWIVDDSRLAMEACARELAPDHDVECFGDGSEAIERAASGPLPDVVLLDWHMPGISGVEVLRFFRASPRTVGLPILVLTSTGTDLDLIEALQAGADDYVAKTCARAELVARIGSLVRTKELRERAETAERELAGLLVSERAARADAESANHVKDDFLATLSHELRTPLNAILGWAQLLRSGTLSPELATRALETVERSAHAQASIIEDLLDVSRIVSGKLRLELLDTDVADAAEQALETLRPVAARKGVELHANIAHAALIAGDAARLQQIVWNLLSNAIRFTRAGGSVTVEVVPTDDVVLVRVADTGEGISAELLPRIFDRFRQGDSTSTRTHGGLGLGLAIVSHLVELHQGSVRASSAGPGQGASFEVSFPRVARVPRKISPSPEAPLGLMRLDRLNILVVDDDSDSLELLTIALAARGASVSAVPCAKDALDSLAQTAHDVLVSDIMMPEIDGYALIRAVRAGDPRHGASIPAIALSAATREEDRARALAAGFHLHLSKPVEMTSLVAAIARLAAPAARP